MTIRYSVYRLTVLMPVLMVLLLQKEIFVWLEVMPDQVELKCAIITHGGQCVMILGVSRMLEWCADNLNYHHHVSIRLPTI